MSKEGNTKGSTAKTFYSVENLRVSPINDVEDIEHLESSIDAIRALLPEDCDFEKFLEESLQSSEEIDDNPDGPRYNGINDPQNPSNIFHYFEYSLNPFLKVIMLIKTETDEYHIVSVSLSGAGCLNRLQIVNKFQWSNIYEGDVTARFHDKEFCFIEPSFFKNRKKIRLNKPCEISLFGVALSCEHQEEQSIDIKEGEFYEAVLKEFLDNNPDKTASDMPPVSISTKGMTLLEVNEYKTVYDYRASVLSVAEDDFYGGKCFKCTVIIYKGACEQDFIAANLYVSEHVLEDYIPKEGDDIYGVMVLFGSHYDHNSPADKVNYK